MPDSALSAVVEQYVRSKVSPTKAERNYISAKYHTLKDYLDGASFRSGSYARRTAIHPPHDLDVIWITHQTAVMDEPVAVMKALAADLRRKYAAGGGADPLISIQTHSVTLEFDDIESGFGVDVMPGVPHEDLKNEFGFPIYMVPEILKQNHCHRTERYAAGDPIDWIDSDPKGYIELARQIDDLSSGIFRKVAKLVKAWRHGRKMTHGDRFKLKSFHVELIVLEQFRNNPQMTALEGLREAFNVLPNYILGAPMIPDRADNSKYVDDYLANPTGTATQRSLILDEQRAAVKIIQQLEAADDEAGALVILDQLVKEGEAATTSAGPGTRITAPPPRQWAQ